MSKLFGVVIARRKPATSFRSSGRCCLTSRALRCLAGGLSLNAPVSVIFKPAIRGTT